MVRGHAEALMPLIARVMERAGLDFAALDRIAVTTGPGSFTGLRVGIAAARGIALAAGKPAIGLTTLAAFAAPLIAADDTLPVVAAIDARHDHVYLQVFGPGGRTIVTPRLAPLREALRVAATGAPRFVGTAAELLAAAWPPANARRASSMRAARPTSTGWRGSAPPRDETGCAAEAALPARARRPAAGRRAIGAPMIGLFSNLFARGEPVLSEAARRDAAAIAALHARLVPARLERTGGRGPADRPPCHRASRHDRAKLAGFIMSRLVEDEAEILSVAVASVPARPRAGAQAARPASAPAGGSWARARCSWKSTNTMRAAIRLYDRAGFREISRRPNYYPGTGGKAAAALVLRRDLV